MLWYFIEIWINFFCFLQGMYGILVSWPGIETEPPAIEGEVLTTGPPFKSPEIWIMIVGIFGCTWSN